MVCKDLYSKEGIKFKFVSVAAKVASFFSCSIVSLYQPVHEQSLQEMLRNARQQQHNRKAKQHNTTHLKQSF